MDQRSAEDPCRRGTCQEIYSDLNSKRNTLAPLQDCRKRNIFMTTAISAVLSTIG